MVDFKKINLAYDRLRKDSVDGLRANDEHRSNHSGVILRVKDSNYEWTEPRPSSEQGRPEVRRPPSGSQTKTTSFGNRDDNIIRITQGVCSGVDKKMSLKLPNGCKIYFDPNDAEQVYEDKITGQFISKGGGYHVDERVNRTLKKANFKAFVTIRGQYLASRNGGKTGGEVGYQQVIRDLIKNGSPKFEGILEHGGEFGFLMKGQVIYSEGTTIEHDWY